MENFLTFIVFFLLVSTLGDVESSSILFYFGVSTYSHRVFIWPLVEELTARGHNVSFLSPYPNKDPHPNPNVTDLVPPQLTHLFSSVFDEDSDRIQDRFNGNRNAIWALLPSLGIKSCELLLQSPEWRDWIWKSQFDLVVVDALYSECGLGLAFKFKARVIYFKAKTVFPWEFDMVGLPLESSWIPDLQHDFPQEMNFLTRVQNTLIPIYNHWYHRWVYQPQLNDLLRTELDLPEMPPIHELQGGISLFLFNSHYTTDYPRSLPPMYVPIAGMVTQVTKLKQLPVVIDFELTRATSLCSLN